MTETNGGTTDVLATRERYRQLMGYALGVGIVAGGGALVAGAVLDRDLLVFLGVGVYWAGTLTHAVLERRSPVAVRDERETQISREAGELTMIVAAYALILAAPAVTVLDVTGIADVSGFVWGAVTAVTLLFLLLGVAHWYVERERT